MTGAMIVSWGTSVRGREGKSLEVFGRALERFEGLAKSGRIHGHREYFALTGNATKRGGMMVVDGELSELSQLLIEPDMVRLLTEAAEICDNFDVQLFAGGSDQAVQEQVGMFMSVLQDEGYLQ